MSKALSTLFLLAFPLLTILLGPSQPSIRFWYPEQRSARIACVVVGAIQELVVIGIVLSWW